MRQTIKIDLPARLFFEAMYSTEEECLEWKPFKAVRTVEKFSESEKIAQFQPDIGFALKYIMSVPEWITVRIVGRRDFPEPGQYAFAIIPWDIEK